MTTLTVRGNLDTLIVSRFQAKAALLQAGLLDAVEGLMNDPQTDPIARLAWQDAIEFRRHSPALTGVATALGWTDEQLDALFVAASQIEA